MNIRIVDEYSKNNNLNILKEECAELITAASHLQRARGDGYKTLRTEGESMKDLMQAMADCKNAILSVLHSEKIGVNELDELIEEADKKQMELLDVKLHKKPQRCIQLGRNTR